MLTLDKVNDIIADAEASAHQAAAEYFQDKLDGVDRYACGFAWVDITRYDGKPIKGNTKIGRLLKQAGVRQDYRRVFQIWNPSHFPVQNVDTLEAGARAAAEVFRKAGFDAYAGSRLD